MRKLSLAAIAAFAALAMTVAAAPASAEVTDTDGDSCGGLYVEGNSVWGGCLVENMEGSWEFWSPHTYIGTCNVSFDVRIDAEKNFYAVNQKGLGCNGFQREPCTDWQKKETYPWPGHVITAGGLGEKYVFDMCFQAVSSPGYGGWDEAAFDAIVDGNNFLTDFNQWGISINDYIQKAKFHNYDEGEGPEIQILP